MAKSGEAKPRIIHHVSECKVYVGGEADIHTKLFLISRDKLV